MADLTNTQKKSGLARFISEKTSHSRRLPTVWECHASQSQTGAAAANGRNRRSDSRSHDVSRYKASIVRWPKSTTQYSSNQRGNDTLMLSRLTLS